MAPPGASHDDEEPSLWSRLLKEYSPAKGADRREAHIVVLGTPGCGARSLLARLQGRDLGDGPRGYALEYDYRTVTPDGEDDPLGLLHLWHLEGLEYADLLPTVLTAARLPRALLLFVVDLAAPHSLLATLEEWFRRAEEVVSDLAAADPPLLAEAQQNVLRYLATIRSLQSTLPPLPPPTSPVAPSDTATYPESTAAPELGPGVLTRNLGLPIVVVGTKADLVESVISRDSTNLLWGQSGAKPPAQILNFIQFHLRKWCLAHGAALVYTSSQLNTHIPLLRDYIHHRTLGAPLPPASATAIYIPWGTDTLAAIAQLEVGAITDNPLGTPYGLVMRCPAFKPDVEGPSEVQGIDHQSFLARQRDLLQKGAQRERAGEVLKGPAPLAALKAVPPPKKGGKDGLSPTSSDVVQREAQDFFASMETRYKK